MNITLNIPSDITPEALRAILTVAREFETVATPRAASASAATRERGPNVQAYMDAMSAIRERQGQPPLSRFRKGNGMEAMDDETAAMIMLATLNAGDGTAPDAGDGEPPAYADAGDDMGDGESTF